MANFDMVIDTAPMAATMATVGASVVGVTGAVAAMHSAVVAQEEEAARTISQNVDRGFYMLMKSQISQKMASLAAQIASKVLLMQKFRSDILHTKDLMQSDYNRICRRYKKQFSSLDKEAETRVRELDQKAMETAGIYKHFNSTMTDSSAALYVCGEETIRVGIMETNASVKSKTDRALDAMARNVEGTLKYNKGVSHILKTEKNETVTDAYVSALITETMSMFDKGALVSNVYLPQSEHLKGSELIERELRETGGGFVWHEVSAKDKEKVRLAFAKEIEAANTNERIALEMNRLFDESMWSSPTAEGGV